MEHSNISISKHSVEDALYTRLQRMTIDELQRLSGEIWTDFNAHNPGVTIADIANYVLTELDYKLGFDLLDYMTDQNGEFSPRKFGLYLPKEMYPTTAVTLDDYRKLILLQFSQLKNAIFTCDDKKKGCYNLRIELNPFRDENQSKLKNDIRHFFHKNRNLCENLNEIFIYTPPQLSLYAEIEIEPGTDATMLLVQYYCVIQQYLAGSIQIEQQEEQIHLNLSLDEWFEITNDENQRVVIPKLQNTQRELYLKLLKVKGVKAIKTNYLVTRASETESELEIVSNFRKGYGLYIPKCQGDFKVKMFIENIEVAINQDSFIEEVISIDFFKPLSQYEDKPYEWKDDNFPLIKSFPQGIYRDVYSHKNIAYDFPSLYGVSEAGQAKSVSVKHKASARQLKAYLTLYDLIIRRGLSELKGFQDLLVVNDQDSVDTEQRIISKEEWDKAIRDISTDKLNDGLVTPDGGDGYDNIANKNKFRDKNALKNKYFDFLDKLYGVNSHPKWMTEYYYYSETDRDCLKQRMRFLQIVPELTKNRSRAANIYDADTQNNHSNLKIYISALLNLNLDENIVVGNLLSRHNLSMCDKDKKYIVNNMSSESESLKLKPAKLTEDEKQKEYIQLRNDLTYLDNNEICGGLFRGGIELNNYKLINESNTKEFMLAFWNNEESIWMNLKRSSNKEDLNNLANILRHYLIELNRQSEVIYVMEHNFFYPINNKSDILNDQNQSTYRFTDPFTITVIFPDWSARFKSFRFREICYQLIESIVPAHIKTNIYWMNHTQIRLFENSYSKWKLGLSKDYPEEEMRKLQKHIYNVFLEMENEV